MSAVSPYVRELECYLFSFPCLLKRKGGWEGEEGRGANIVRVKIGFYQMSFVSDIYEKR